MSGLQRAANIPELRKRILFTLIMLAVYRVGVEIPTPGINGDALAAFFEKNGGTLFGMFNMFSGGALEIFPYSHWESCHISVHRSLFSY